MIGIPEARGGVRQAVRERISAVVGRGEDPDQRPPHPRTAPLPGRPSIGPAPGRARNLTEPLADPATWHAVAAAVRLAGRGTAWPYAVLLGPETATVRLAGQAPDVEVERAVLADSDATAHPDSAYVCLGSNGADLVFLDLAQAPGVIAVDGDSRAAPTFISRLAQQLPETCRPTILLGTTNVSHWSLTVNADGVVSSLALGLTAASAGLPEQLAVREPDPGPVVIPEAPEPEPAPTFEPLPTLDGHPGLLPLPPRDAALSIGPFAPSAGGPR
ncbi:MAG TPA: hypothetical protein VL551_08655 [Actinospica sp.]|jgi:hypothetical protein|nr:hypothetical protein [Actinospica sp.]